MQNEDSICDVKDSEACISKKKRYTKVIKVFIFKVTYNMLVSTIFFLSIPNNPEWLMKMCVT